MWYLDKLQAKSCLSSFQFRNNNVFWLNNSQTGYFVNKFFFNKTYLFSHPPPPHPHPRRYDAAFSDFEETQLKLRSNPFIDYKQLGLQYKLYACEVTQQVDEI